jgi:hypothetical protein
MSFISHWVSLCHVCNHFYCHTRHSQRKQNRVAVDDILCGNYRKQNSLIWPSVLGLLLTNLVLEIIGNRPLETERTCEWQGTRRNIEWNAIPKNIKTDPFHV